MTNSTTLLRLNTVLRTCALCCLMLGLSQSNYLNAQCTQNTLTFTMFDSFGDGWDGAQYTLIDQNSGISLFTGTLLSGASEVVSFCVPDGCFELNVTPGLFPGEVSWSLSGTDAGILNGAPGSTLFAVNDAACSGGANCPDPYTFIAQGGTYDYEISWSLSSDDGAIASGFATAGTPVCLEEGCLYLELFDSFGDGWNYANYTLLGPLGNVVATGTMDTGAYEFIVIEIGNADCNIPDPPEVIQVETGTLSPQALISDVFLGDCLSASNIQYTGNLNAIGTFSQGSSIGIEEGIILSSGNAMDAEGPNTSGSTGTGFYTDGLNLLDDIADNFTQDAAVFQFDFVAQTDGVTFTYVFASDEYPEFVCGTVNDAFGFFVSGPGYAPNTNIATVPGTTDPVTINNVNNNGAACPPYYSAYYNDNLAGTAHEFDGYTVPLTASIVTEPCATYQIIIAVADAGDAIYDSAVFLEAESFTAGVDVEVTAAASLGQSNPGNCEESGYFFFVNNGDDFSEEVTLNYTVSGSAVDGGLIDPIPSSITFQPGELSLQLPVSSIAGALGLSPESVTITMDPSQGCSCSVEQMQSTLYLCSALMLPVEGLSFQTKYRALEDEVGCIWTTESEHQSSHFEVEHSLDLVNWTTLAVLQAAGNSLEPSEYRFNHKHPSSGELYYRLKQVDINGDFTYSDVQSAHKMRFSTLNPVQPNPNQGSFYLNHDEADELVLRNALGQRVPFIWSEDGNLMLLDPLPGNYILELKSKAGEILGRYRWMVQ